MNLIKTSIVLVIILITKNSESAEEEEFENEFCESRELDYAFNFIDKAQYPNGIMIRKGEFVIIYNDDLLDKSFTPATKLPRIYRNNNFTSGLAIKEVPSCKPNDQECPKISEMAYNLQMVISMNSDNEKRVQYYKNAKLLTDKNDVVYGWTEFPNTAEQFPNSWSEETDLFAFWTQKYEILFVCNKVKKIYHFSFRDRKPIKDTIPTAFRPELTFSSVFELKGQIYLVDNSTKPVIFTYGMKEGYQNKRVVKEMESLSLYELFDCQTLYRPKFSIMNRLAIVLTTTLNVFMALIAASFISFLILQFCLCLIGKEFPFIKRPSSAKPDIDRKPTNKTRTPTFPSD